MRRWIFGLLLVLLLATSALAHSPHIYERDGHKIEVVADGPNGLRITVDGAEDWTYNTSGSLLGPYDAASDPQLVSSVVDQYMADHPVTSKSGNGISLFVGLLVIGAGILSLVKPEIPWYLKHGWALRDAEPSDLALKLNQIGGGIAVLVGVGLFISALLV